MTTWQRDSDVRVKHVSGEPIEYLYKNRSRLYTNYEDLPKLVQKNIARLKWMPVGEWSSLGAWHMLEWYNLNEGKNEKVTSIEYMLYSPKRKKELRATGLWGVI